MKMSLNIISMCSNKEYMYPSLHRKTLGSIHIFYPLVIENWYQDKKYIQKNFYIRNMLTDSFGIKLIFHRRKILMLSICRNSQLKFEMLNYHM